MNASQSSLHKGPTQGHNTRIGVPIEVAREILSDVISIEDAEKTLGIKRYPTDRLLAHDIPVSERALRALADYVQVIPTMFSREELLLSGHTWRIFVPNEHFFGGEEIRVEQLRYRVILRDMPQPLRLKAWRIARECNLQVRPIGLTAALTSTLLAAVKFEHSLTTNYEVLSCSETRPGLALGPCIFKGRHMVRTVGPKECQCEMVEFV